MSLLKSTLEDPVTSAIPFRVRLEPYLVESLCELSRLVGEKNAQRTDVSGLLFGKVEAGLRSAEALKTFPEAGTHSELARRERWETAYRATVEESRHDSELSAFDVVGWFSFRNAGGLLSSDVVFHNSHFRRAEDLALILVREGHSQVTLELYSKADAARITSEDYRWGSVRLSSELRHLSDPIELAMRVKVGEDSYLRAYDNEVPSHLDLIKNKAESASSKLLGFLSRRKADTSSSHVRGFLGDGRRSSDSLYDLGAGFSPSNPARPFFNPYAEASQSSLNRLSAGISDTRPSEAARAAVAPAGPTPEPARATPETAAPVILTAKAPLVPPPGAPSPAPWSASGAPASGGGYAAAPARAIDPSFGSSTAETRVTPPTYPPFLDAPEVDFSRIGHSPRAARPPQTEVGGLPVLLRPARRRRSFPWGSAVTLFALCCVCAFGILAFTGNLQSDSGRIGQIFQSIFPSPELNLRVRNEEDNRIRLSWNQHNRIVTAASDATLQIFDGTDHRDVHLDGRQVADGSVLYRPITNDVTFRLEVRSEQGAVSGSVRILDGLAGQPQPTLDVSAPASAYSSSTPSNSAAPSSSDLPDPSVNPAPSIIRGNSEIATGAVRTPDVGAPAPVPETASSPITSTQVPVRPQPRSLTPRHAARYETPENIQPIQPSNGEIVNGWETSSTRARRKPYTPSTVFPDATSNGVPGPNSAYVPPKPLIQVMPNTRTLAAGAISAPTRVEVQVSIDRAGKVSAARLVGGAVNDQVASVALAAARQWTFNPATNNGQSVDSQHIIRFEFRPEQR